MDIMRGGSCVNNVVAVVLVLVSVLSLSGAKSVAYDSGMSIKTRILSMFIVRICTY